VRGVGLGQPKGVGQQLDEHPVAVGVRGQGQRGGGEGDRAGGAPAGEGVAGLGAAQVAAQPWGPDRQGDRRGAPAAQQDQPTGQLRSGGGGADQLRGEG
jgi:hypothetical protein